MTSKKPTKKETFEVLARIARKTGDSQDIRNAMRFGIENRISTTTIRRLLSK